MNFFKHTLCLLLCNVLCLSLYAQDEEVLTRPSQRSQVLDDTSKQVYGPKTSRYYYESTVFNNEFKSESIDTLIRNFHLYNFVQKLGYEYQDLGNIATAMSPIYYKLPRQIGVSSGWHANDPFWDLEPIRYFDTKSPYSNMNVVLGGKGRSMTSVVYSRNIKPNWSFGFNYRGLFIDKQFSRSGKGDRNVRSNYYDIFMTYHTKDSSYWAFFDFKRLRHVAIESGGVLLPSGAEFEDYFDPFAQPNLVDAQNRDLRTNIHFFHQYRLVKGMELYHQVDKYRQYVEFVDGDPDTNTEFYDHVAILNTTRTFDTELFKTVRNEVGLKGTIGNVFYKGYWAARNFSMDYKHLDESDFRLRTKGTEYYVGGKASLRFKEKFNLTAEADYLLSTNYKAKASVISPWLEASVARYEYKPTFVQQLYLGAHDAWLNDFSNVEANQIQGFAQYRRPWFMLAAGGTVTALKNYVFFKQDTSRNEQLVTPQQSSGNQFIQSPEVRASITLLKRVSISGKAVYSSLIENSADAIQLPEWLLHGQLAYQNIFFDGNFDIQIGVEAHWQSTYFANGYDVPTQQFYTQQTFVNNEYLVLDGFFNWKMKRGRMFFKYNNIMQAITRTGYFPTPYYPAQANVFDFGFDWSFYN